MSQPIDNIVDTSLADALQKLNPRLAATIDRLVAQGADEDILTNAMSSIIAKQTARPSEAAMASAAIFAYIQRACAARSAQEAVS